MVTTVLLVLSFCSAAQLTSSARARDTLPDLYPSLIQLHQLESIVIRYRDDEFDQPFIMTFLGQLRDRDELLPLLRLLVLAEEDTFGTRTDEKLDDEDRITLEFFLKFHKRRPKVHLFARGAEYQFDSHYYGESCVQNMSNAVDSSRLSFLKPDNPPIDAVRRYRIPMRDPKVDCTDFFDS